MVTSSGFKSTWLLPVEMDVKQRKTIPNGALVMVLHTCEFPQGNMWAKRIAIRAVEALTREDFVGVLQWDTMGGDAWGVPFQRASDKSGIAERLRKLQPQDMQSFGPTLTQALAKLQNAPAVQKHVLIISDGDPSAPSGATVQSYIDNKISISTICIGPHGARDTGMMKKLSKDTNGRYYFVEDPEDLPGIFMREALHVRRNLINEETFTPAIALETPPISGLSAIGFPPLHGYVITTPKPTAEIPLVSHEPHQDPVLAHWRYGLARTAAFTPDSGGRWTTDWTGWPGYEPFFAQLVRYVSKRGGGDFFRVERTIDGDRGRIIVDALDPDGRYLDDLEIKGRLLDPKMDEQEVSLQQVGPGRYEAEFSARRAGSYLLSLEYDDGAGLEGHYQTGINVSYSPEYRHLVSDREKLESLAVASGGRVLAPTDDPFDPEVPYQKSRLPLWEEILRIATILFFLDVFCRRVLLSLEPAKRAVAWLRRRRDTQAESTVTLSALLERQQEVRKETSGPSDRKKKRIEIARDSGDEPPAVAGGPSVAPTPKASAEEPAPGPSSFTDRLLEAKRKAREDLNEQDD
ncbi:MAG: VWA domain-containing protein [Planctomycetota bacterium]